MYIICNVNKFIQLLQLISFDRKLAKLQFFSVKTQLKKAMCAILSN